MAAAAAAAAAVVALVEVDAALTVCQADANERQVFITHGQGALKYPFGLCRAHIQGSE